MVPFESSEALAAGIPGAVFQALPPGSHAAFDIDDSIAAATLAFVSGDAEAAVNERVLMTVLFTDIVGSTEQVVAGGDSRWRHQLDAHDELWIRCWPSMAEHARSTPATASLRSSTGPPRPPGALWIWFPRLPPVASASARGCTSENASGAATSGADWRYTSEPASVPWPEKAKY